jgi:polar amino acid transport system substrate-binding protein
MFSQDVSRRGRRGAKIGILVVFAVSVVLTGCGAESDSNEPATNKDAASLLPADIRSAGVVRVASTFGYPPEQFYEEDGTTPTGFSVEIGEALGEQLGVEFRFENVGFDAILPGISADRYDAAISSMSITEERSKQVNFVKYLDAGGSLIVRGDNDDIQGLEDLCGKTVSNTTGSIYTEDLEEYSKTECEAQGKEKITVTSFADAAAPNQAVATGRADACFRDFTANAYLAQNSDGAFKVVGEIVKTTPYGVAVGKDDMQLAEAISGALNAIIEDGTYLKILEKWDVDEAAIQTADIVEVTD